MKAPLKVLIATTIISIALISVVFYRYNIIEGVQRTSQTSEQVTPKEVPQPKFSLTNANKAATPSKPAESSSPASTTASLENGKKLYEEKTCVLCHGASGKADTPTGKAMNSTNLTLGTFHHNTDNLAAVPYIIKVLENGVPGTAMVSFKEQIPKEQDRKDLAEYVHSLSKK